VASAGRRIVIEFLGKDTSAGSTAVAVQKKFGKLGGSLDAVGQKAGKMLAVGAAAGGVALFKMTQAAAEDDLAQRKLADTLTKGAGATQAQIAQTEAWISAQGKATGVTDDELRPALSRLAAATKDVDEAQRLASLGMDVAAGRGVSLKSVTDALAKAQNGSMGGLSRLGVNIKKANGETKSLDQVTKELAQTYGGAAANAADTTAGRQKILTTRLSELGEKIGGYVLPALEKMTDVGIKLSDWISEHTRLVGTAIAVVGSFAVVLYTISAAMRAYLVITKAWTAITKIATAVQLALNAAWVSNPIGIVVVAIVALVAALVIAYKKSETFRRIVNAAFHGVAVAAKAVFGFIVKVVSTTFNWIKDHWKTILAILTGPIGIAVLVIAKHWDKIKSGAAKVKDWIVSKFNAVVGFFRGIPGKISSAASGMWDGIKNSFKSAINTIIGWWNNLSFSINIPDGIPGLPDSFSINTPNLPYLARGTASFRGGLAVVGERGPELVNMPRGTSVTPAGRTADLLGGGVNVIVQGNLFGDARAIARELERLLRAEERRSGRRILLGS
jgi:phage-related protein